MYMTYFFAQTIRDQKPKIIAQKFCKRPEMTKVYRQLYKDLDNNKYFKIGYTHNIKDIY